MPSAGGSPVGPGPSSPSGLRAPQPSPTIGQCLNGGLGWLEVECIRCKTRASLPLTGRSQLRDPTSSYFGFGVRLT